MGGNKDIQVTMSSNQEITREKKLTLKVCYGTLFMLALQPGKILPGQLFLAADSEREILVTEIPDNFG
jgi:hypothetical protein